MAAPKGRKRRRTDPKLAIRYVAPSELTPAKRNPRIMPEHEMAALKRSLERWGFVDPIVVRREDGSIIGGHQRIDAAVEMGIDAVPIIELDVSELDAMILNEALNRIHGTWDEPSLSLHQEEIRLAGGDLTLTGFSDEELEVYRRALIGEGGGDEREDEVPEPPEEPTSKLGDLWLCGDHRLLCGDATKPEDVARLMAGEKADVLLADPPYGISVVKVSKGRATVGGAKPFGKVGGDKIAPVNYYAPILGDDKPFEPVSFLSLAEQSIIWGGNYCASRLPDSRCWLVWDKNNTGNFADAELAWTSFDKGIRLYRHTWNGLVREGRRDEEGIKRMHPTQKPVGMFGAILEDFTQAGAIILDPFLGSGTTMIACEKLGRRCYGMDIEPRYVDVAVTRWETYTGEKAEIERKD